MDNINTSIEVRKIVLKHLENPNSRVVLTGLDATGKSTLCSELFPKYYVLKSASSINSLVFDNSKEFYAGFRVFDRLAYIDYHVHYPILMEYDEDGLRQYSDGGARMLINSAFNNKDVLIICYLVPLYLNKTEQPEYVVTHLNQLGTQYLNYMKSLVKQGFLGKIILVDGDGTKFRIENMNFMD